MVDTALDALAPDIELCLGDRSGYVCRPINDAKMRKRNVLVARDDISDDDRGGSAPASPPGNCNQSTVVVGPGLARTCPRGAYHATGAAPGRLYAWGCSLMVAVAECGGAPRQRSMPLHFGGGAAHQ